MAEQTYTREQVNKALNAACDTIIEELDLPDTGARDAMNLLVNYTGELLDQPDATLDDAADNYSISEAELADGDRTPLQVIAGWIGS